MDLEHNAIRFDTGTMSKVKRHDKGFLTAWGTMARVGVQEYYKKDGTVSRELRLPEEVFKQDSLESFNEIPITDGHPRVVVDVNNARDYQRGLTSDKTKINDDGTFTINKLTVTDKELLNKIDSGKIQISCGYECSLEKKQGEHEKYGKYDAIQRNIRGNHVAIVYNARAGNQARLHLDSLDYEGDVAYIINSKNIEMETLKIDEKTFEVPKELSSLITKNFEDNKKKIDNLQEKYDKMYTEAEKNKKTMEEEKKKKDIEEQKKDEIDWKAKYDELEKSIPERAKEFSKVFDSAKELLEKEDFEKIDSKDLLSIKKSVLVAKKIDIENKTDSYIEARFDVFCEEQTKAKEDEKQLGGFLANAKAKKEDSVKELIEKHIEKLTNNWKGNK